MYKPLRSAKLSIRGSDSSHIGKQHFRYDRAKTNELEAEVAPTS